jgi:arylformamidase
MKDITRALYPGHPVWPGDTAFSLEVTARIDAGSSVNLMKLATTTHLGSHLDAPFHYLQNGPTLEAVPLALLVGEAQVIDARGHHPVGPEVLEGPLPERVLFYSGQPARWERFPEGFAPLTTELIDALAERGVKLVGTDSPSVDAFSSKDLPVHHRIGAHGLYILEGLNLAGVAPGRYELICLPLSLVGADASPVRAVLR